MGKIFISYRRTDATPFAGELGRELRRIFGDEQVFRDKEDIDGGEDWRQKVLFEIGRDSVLLVLIGKDWANAEDAQGKRRLDNSDDPLRLEIGNGFESGAVILPILVENAQMPSEEELPPELRLLARKTALNLRDSDWDNDLANIRRALERVGFKPVDSLAQTAPQERQTALPMLNKNVFGLIMGTIGALLVSLVLLAVALGNLDRTGHIGAAVFSIGGLILGVLAWRELRHSRPRVQILGVVVCILAVLGFFVALAGMGSRTTGVTSVPLLKDHAVIRYNPTLWQVDTIVPTQPGTFQLDHKSGEAWMKVTSERLPIGVEKVVEHSLAEVKKVDPTAKVARQGSRSVNGRNMVFREIEATISDVPFTYYIHYYCDTSGYIEFIGWTYRSLLKEYRSTIEEFLEGFEVTDQSVPLLKDQVTDQSVPLLKDHAVIRYNPTLWQVDTIVPTQPGTFQLDHKSGEAWMKVTSERLPIGVEKVVEHSLAEVKKVDPTAKVARQGSRSVNGRNMVFREIEATISDVPFTYYIHYYCDTSGYIEFIGWTYRSLLKEYRSTIEEFLEGFEVTDQTPGPPSPETSVSPPPTNSAPKP